MNYQTATNFELNKRLAELIGMQIADVFDSPFNYATSQKDAITRKTEYESRCPNTVWARKNGEPWEQFVFTHDWCQTMPLAVKFGVTPILEDGYYFATNDPYEVYQPHGKNESDGFFQVSMDEETPLRAIVICLIKILEAKSGN